MDILKLAELYLLATIDYKVFDWIKAAEIIRDKKPKKAWAGLKEDWGWTSDIIYEDGKPTSGDFAYLSSDWATPILVLEYDDKPEETINCFVWEKDTKWEANTRWPPEALEILNSFGGPKPTTFGPGAACKSCGYENPYADADPDYECYQCKMRNEKWAMLKSASKETVWKDLEASMHGAKATLERHLKHMKGEGKVPDSHLKQIRDFAGNLSLLCNMLLNGEEYTAEEKDKAIKDETT